MSALGWIRNDRFRTRQAQDPIRKAAAGRPSMPYGSGFSAMPGRLGTVEREGLNPTFSRTHLPLLLVSLSAAEPRCAEVTKGQPHNARGPKTCWAASDLLVRRAYDGDALRQIPPIAEPWRASSRCRPIRIASSFWYCYGTHG